MTRALHLVARRRIPAMIDEGRGGTTARRHVEACLSCQAEAARYRSLARLLAGVRRQEAHAPKGLSAAVLASLHGPLRRRSMLQPSHGVAAALAVAGAVAVVTWHRRRAA